MGVNPALAHEKMECGAGGQTPTGMRFLFWLSLLVVPLGAAPLHWASGDTRTHLLELFSSEGCSSCPPAEAWLAGLSEAPGLWRDFVPVAFPVTYWDRLGWPDRLARKEFTDRQYAYATAWRSSNVYTPAFVLDGIEWRRAGGPPPGSMEKSGVLRIDYERGGRCRVMFERAGVFEVHVAWLGGGIVSRVRAGENGGRTLPHEFVALSLRTVPLQKGRAEMDLPLPVVAGVTRLALAVWVTHAGSQAPLQATGGWVE